MFFAGSVTWLASPFDGHDLAALRHGAAQVPGFVPGTTGLVAVALSGTAPGLDSTDVRLLWGPHDLVDAWRN